MKKVYEVYEINEQKLQGLKKNSVVYYRKIAFKNIVGVNKIARERNILLVKLPMVKIKKPKPPRQLCKSFIHYLLGIVSPSLIYYYCIDEDVIGEYKEKLTLCEISELRLKVLKRTCTKEEYKRLKHLTIEV